MSGLTEFLLARIAEDDEHAREYGDDDTPGTWSHWALAQGEAKRSLIDIHPEAVSEPLRPGARWAYAEVLRRLALSYADHPDYREEWRP